MYDLPFEVFIEVLEKVVNAVEPVVNGKPIDCMVVQWIH